MNQVGDNYLFTVAAHTTGATYVWKYWDGDTAASVKSTGSAFKQLNLGGNPAEGFTVPVKCVVCDAAQGDVIYSTDGRLAVNNPPTVYGSPDQTVNDGAFPYQTQVTVEAYDLEDAGLTFLWYNGTNPISGQDTTATSSTVEGTYYGTLTGLTRDLYNSQFDTTIYGSGTTITCKIIDGDSGTTRLNFEMRGYDPASPAFSVAATPESLTAQATSLTTQVIAPNQAIALSAYAYDEVPGNLVFTWELNGTNGWTAPDIPFIYVNNGTQQEQGYKSEWARQVGGETSAGVKRCIISVKNEQTNKITLTYLDINTVLNAAPALSAVGIYDATTGAPITGPITKAASPTRTLVRFSGTASDANSDVVNFEWNVTAPVSPTSYELYGRDAYVDVSDWPAGGYSTIGIVTAYDKYAQASTPANIPTITIN